MPRFSRRVWGFVVAIIALQFANAALTFRFDYAPARERACFLWRQNPRPEAEAAWRAALATIRQRELKVRYAFGGIAVAVGGVAVWIALRKRREPAFISIAQGLGQ